MNFDDLNDKQIEEKVLSFHNSVDKIDKMLNQALNANIYDKLTLKEKADFDLFIAYTLNTLYWIYLRTKGHDPNTSEVKNQLDRVKEYMLKAKQAHERNTIRPVLDKAATGRFIKHALHHSKDQKDGGPPPNKKTKFSD